MATGFRMPSPGCDGRRPFLRGQSQNSVTDAQNPIDGRVWRLRFGEISRIDTSGERPAFPQIPVDRTRKLSAARRSLELRGDLAAFFYALRPVLKHDNGLPTSVILLRFDQIRGTRADSPEFSGQEGRWLPWGPPRQLRARIGMFLSLVSPHLSH